MRFDIRLNDDHRARIIVRHTTETRLAITCFRGRTRRLAGNFKAFSRSPDVFDHQLILEGVRMNTLDEIHDLLREQDRKKFVSEFSCTIDVKRPIGWESTDEIGKYPSDVLEVFHPNRKSTALRVKPSCTSILAPLTSLVTLVCELVLEEDDAWAIIVHTMYPGSDIGELKDDVTQREQRVFFDWDHPGA